MSTRANLETLFATALQDYPDMYERYIAGDPLVVCQVRAIASFLANLSGDIDVATLEPFLKSMDRSIIADATNKGILPIATPCQYQVEINNTGNSIVGLNAGRKIEDNQGRPWRLLATANIPANGSFTVAVEQSEVREVEYTVPFSETFHQVFIGIRESLFLARLAVHDDSIPVQTYTYMPRWMNVAPGEPVVMIKSDSMQRILVEFGDSDRAGITVQAGQVITFSVTESYGEIDVTRLKEATLQEVLSNPEQKIKVKFKTNGLIRAGASPLTVSQLRLLASYPFYDESAVFLGNFDYLARSKFMARADYLCVWNETVHEKYFGVSYSDINHLQLAVKAKNPLEQATLESEIAALLSRADTLFVDRVKTHAIVEREIAITITGRLQPIHDIDTVVAQIKGLLIGKYGRGTVAASHWVVQGFNQQEIATQIRSNIQAFQDRISDFSIQVEDLSTNSIKPNEWAYLSTDSIVINMTRTAENGGSLWTM